MPGSLCRTAPVSAPCGHVARAWPFHPSRDAAHDAKVSHVVSILDPEWPVPEVFGTFGEHAKLGLRFHDIIDERNTDMGRTRR
jgi:hypothetical protein